MLKRLKNMPIGAMALLIVFAFCVAYSLFHLVAGILDRNPHFIVGGIGFTLVGIPLIIICLNATKDDRHDA